MISRDFFPALIPVVESLDRLGVPYHIGGSVASSAYGFPRSTMDVDLVADLALRDVPALVRGLIATYYVDEDAVREAVERHASFNVIHLETMYKVDVFAVGTSLYDRTSFERRERKVLGEGPDARTFYVASAEDIILRKLASYRDSGGAFDRQLRDVHDVLAVLGDDADRTYLRRWAPSLGIADLLEDSLREADEARGT